MIPPEEHTADGEGFVEPPVSVDSARTSVAHATPGGAESGALVARAAVQDTDLADLIQVWPNLAPEVRAGILMIVRQSAKK
jgi:hypothetical protein